MTSHPKSLQSRRASISAKRASQVSAIGNYSTSTSRNLVTSTKSSCAKFAALNSIQTFFCLNTYDGYIKERVSYFVAMVGSGTDVSLFQTKLSLVRRVLKYLPPNPTWTRMSRKFIKAITKSMFVKLATTLSLVLRISSSISKRFMRLR